MENETIKTILITAMVIVAAPVYLYLVFRWLSTAIFRSYFEIKKDFEGQ